ncbi:diadenylate cyclase CdaA [Prochlorococcus marinus]|uniref:diadenylate cyclase CdaA n=1 Tax=Prochlorococcus marinus TaxID=1219 RepID=UPI0022B2E777|nr:diadenylate cyclase CdaA [Prochlorococcus marinus]
MNIWWLINLRFLLDAVFASALAIVLFSRVKEPRTLWLLRGYLFLASLAWCVQRYANLPITSKLVDALLLACSLSLAILWQGELRRLMELLGTGRLAVLLGNTQKGFQSNTSTVTQLAEAAGRLSQNRRGALIVLDMGSDLRPEDFLYSGVPIDAEVSTELLLNLFAAETPLHDGAVLLKGNRIISAGVILPLSRQSISRYGTRHLAALGITERFDRCICVVVSEETGTLSLANQGRLERPITSSRLLDLLKEFMSASSVSVVSKATQASSNSSKPLPYSSDAPSINKKSDLSSDQT